MHRTFSLGLYPFSYIFCEYPGKYLPVCFCIQFIPHVLPFRGLCHTIFAYISVLISSYTSVHTQKPLLHKILLHSRDRGKDGAQLGPVVPTSTPWTQIYVYGAPLSQRNVTPWLGRERPAPQARETLKPAKQTEKQSQKDVIRLLSIIFTLGILSPVLIGYLRQPPHSHSLQVNLTLFALTLLLIPLPCPHPPPSLYVLSRPWSFHLANPLPTEPHPKY